MIKVFIIVFIMWVISGVAFLCWALCAAGKSNSSDDGSQDKYNNKSDLSNIKGGKR